MKLSAVDWGSGQCNSLKERRLFAGRRRAIILWPSTTRYSGSLCLDELVVSMSLLAWQGCIILYQERASVRESMEQHRGGQDFTPLMRQAPRWV